MKNIITHRIQCLNDYISQTGLPLLLVGFLAMEAKELRLNNWIKSPDGLPMSISAIEQLRFNRNEEYLFGYCKDDHINGADPSSCEGIPLTEEIIINAGFKKFHKRSHYYLPP
jgi:hypothetical protein